MTSHNKQLMNEIIDAQPDFSQSVSGKTLLSNFHDHRYLDESTRKLLWRNAQVERSFFGDGILDHYEEYILQQNHVIRNAYKNLIMAFISTSINFNNKPESDPHILLVEELEKTFKSHRVINFWLKLSDFIDCETIAPWLLVTPVYGYTYEDLAIL